jgi:hypothetical protein
VCFLYLIYLNNCKHAKPLFHYCFYIPSPLVPALVTAFQREASNGHQQKAEDCNTDACKSIQLHCVTNSYPVTNHILLLKANRPQTSCCSLSCSLSTFVCILSLQGCVSCIKLTSVFGQFVCFNSAHVKLAYKVLSATFATFIRQFFIQK